MYDSLTGTFSEGHRSLPLVSVSCVPTFLAGELCTHWWALRCRLEVPARHTVHFNARATLYGKFNGAICIYYISIPTNLPKFQESSRFWAYSKILRVSCQIFRKTFVRICYLSVPNHSLSIQPFPWKSTNGRGTLEGYLLRAHLFGWVPQAGEIGNNNVTEKFTVI